MWIFFLILVIIFEIIADVMSKEWSLNNRFWFLAGGTGFYLASNLAWLFSLKYGSGLARGVSIFSVVTLLLAIVIGIGFYKEEITRLQGVGIALGLLSLIMIFWEDIF